VIISLNSINQLTVVMEMRCVIFEIGTGFLNIIQMNFSFKVLNYRICNVLFVVQVTEVHQLIQVLSKRSEDLVHSDRRPQEVANMIAEANIAILVCIPTAVLLNLATSIQYAVCM
jgi:hypothetical protein